MDSWHGTTILSVRKGDKVAIAADGQVSFGNNVIKSTANKIRSINKDTVFAGFAGSTADALTLFERLENKIVQYQQSLDRACVELAKDWRMDRYLRRLEAMLIVVDGERTFILSGSGDVLEPEDGVAAIGSGGNYALAAAKALMDTEYNAEEIVRRSMKIAGDICVFTNHHLTLKILDSKVAINL